jgi:hypothetical protein
MLAKIGSKEYSINIAEIIVIATFVWENFSTFDKNLNKITKDHIVPTINKKELKNPKIGLTKLMIISVI